MFVAPEELLGVVLPLELKNFDKSAEGGDGAAGVELADGAESPNFGNVLCVGGDGGANKARTATDVA